MRFPRFAASAVGAVFVLLVLSGCSGSVDGPLIEGNRRNGGTDAIVMGELVAESECLYLFWPDADTRFPVIWPHGSSWDAEQSAVVLPGSTVVHRGDWVEGSGGYHNGNLAQFTNAEGVALAEACVDNQYREIAVFNSPGAIDVRPSE